MKAIIEADVPDFQIGQEVSIYFKDTMMIKGVVQEQKTGHWIEVIDKWGDVVTTINGYKCSECGEFNADKDNYCPNCGARMESEE